MDVVGTSRGFILVVEDDQDIRDMEQLLLLQEGYDTLGVASSDAAFSALRQGTVRPDLIVLDIWMNQPDSGWRMLRALQADVATSAIPVVVTSGQVWMMAEMMTDFPQAHYRFLKKPYAPATLLGKVRELIDAQFSA